MGPKAQEGDEQGDQTARTRGCPMEPLATHTAPILWVHTATGQSCRGGEGGNSGHRQQSLKPRRWCGSALMVL